MNNLFLTFICTTYFVLNDGLFAQQTSTDPECMKEIFIKNFSNLNTNLGAATLCPLNTTCSVGCPPSCPATCPPKHDCPQLVPCEKESAQFFCLKDYVKDAAGNCILKKDCPKCLLKFKTS